MSELLSIEMFLKLNGTATYENQYTDKDKILMFLEQTEKDNITYFKLKSITEQELPQFEKDFKFIRETKKFAIYKRRIK